MKITIHQSLCGEQKKEWSLLKTTLSDNVLANRIAFNTGLHDQVGGTKWLPTVRGFIQDDFFLVMKTYPDTSPDVRPRRVYSHVLMIEKEQVSAINDIAALFSFFPIEMDKSVSIEPINFDTNSSSELILPKEFQGRFNKVIHGYRKTKDFKDTIIWVGEQDFHQAVFKFWKILTQTEKANLNFGIYFNVETIPKQGLNFITTPETIEDKFSNQGYFVVRKNDTQILTDIVEQFIAEDEIVGERIKAFQEAIEVKQISRQELDRIIIGIKSFEEFETVTDLKRLISLSHIVAEFSPSVKAGVAFKQKLLDKICLLLFTADVSEFTIARNFPIENFSESESKLSKAIGEWVDANLFSIESTKKKNYSLVFTQLEQPSISKWWLKIFNPKIKDFLKNLSAASVDIIFNWLKLDFKIFSSIQSEIDNSSVAENFFSSQLPSNFDKTNFKELKEFALKKGWYKFHATLLIAEYPFEVAAKEQLKIDTSSSSLDGIRVLAQNAKAKSVVDFAVFNGDKRFIDIAGQQCKEDSTLLEKIDFTKANWNAVWSAAISKGLSISNSFKDAQKKIFKLFDCIVDGQAISENIWDKISDSEFANVLEYKNRQKLWNRIPSKYQTKFLAKTSATLLESIHKNPTVEIPDDKVLSDYIIEYAIGFFLQTNPVKNALPIFNKYASFPEHYIATYIRNYQGQISAIEATQLGKLVNSRSYKNVADTIYYKASKNNNWKFALAECHFLLDFFLKGALVFSGILNNVNITTDQWWDSAEEIIIDLYPNLNSLVTVWKKAGGEEADLLMNATTRNVWIDAIHNLRNGKFSNVNMCSLLKQIKKHYGDNEKFKIIYDLRKNYISC